MRASQQVRLISAALLTVGLSTVTGCPQLAGSVSAPQKAHFSIGFTRDVVVQTLDTSAVAGPVNPAEDTTIDVLLYSSGALSPGDVTIDLQLVAGDSVVLEREVTLERTEFEPLPASIPQVSESLDGSKLDTRYAAKLVLRCAACDANALFPGGYAWHATVQRAPGVLFRGTIDFSYSLYLGPILTE